MSFIANLSGVNLTFKSTLDGTAQIPHHIVDNFDYVTLGDETVTGLTVAKGLTVPVGAILAIIECQGSVRWKAANNPTASLGKRLEDGDTLIYRGTLSAIRFIQTISGSALEVSYYRRAKA